MAETMMASQTAARQDRGDRPKYAAGPLERNRKGSVPPEIANAIPNTKLASVGRRNRSIPGTNLNNRP